MYRKFLVLQLPLIWPHSIEARDFNCPSMVFTGAKYFRNRGKMIESIRKKRTCLAYPREAEENGLTLPAKMVGGTSIRRHRAIRT